MWNSNSNNRSLRRAIFPGAFVIVNSYFNASWSVRTVSRLPSRKGHRNWPAITTERHSRCVFASSFFLSLEALYQYLIGLTGPTGRFVVRRSQSVYCMHRCRQFNYLSLRVVWGSPVLLMSHSSTPRLLSLRRLTTERLVLVFAQPFVERRDNERIIG